RQNPQYREKERGKWRKWSKTKPKEYHSTRIQQWRETYPERWKEIMKKASTNGLHKRWYAKNKGKKLAYARRRSKEKFPFHGLLKAVADCRAGRISAEELEQAYRRALTQSDA